NRIVTASDECARLFEVATGKKIGGLTGNEFFVTSANFSPDGSRILTSSCDSTSHIWDAATLSQIAILSCPGGANVFSSTFNHDGTRILTAAWGLSLGGLREEKRTVCLWDGASAKLIAILGTDEA